MQDLSLRLKLARTAKRLSQGELAAMAGMSARTLLRYESGEAQVDHLPGYKLLRLAQALGVTVEYLLGAPEATWVPGA